jgi:hypothetical protein
MFNTHIYHLLPPICFGVSYTIFREIIALFVQKLYALVLSSLYLVFLLLQINFVCLVSIIVTIIHYIIYFLSK